MKKYRNQCIALIGFFGGIWLTRKILKKKQTNQKPLREKLLENSDNDIENYFIKLFTSEQTKNSLYSIGNEIVSSPEVVNEVKNFSYKTLSSLINNKKIMTDLKEALISHLDNNPMSNEFKTFLMNDKISSKVDSFLISVVTDSDFSEEVSNKLMQLCRIAINHRKVEIETNEFVKEIINDDKLIKEIYFKAFDIFTTSYQNAKH